MPTDPSLVLAMPEMREEYWDIPEIACVLRVVTRIHVGAIVALCVWLVTQALNAGSISALFQLTSNQSQVTCRCEFKLTPILPGNRQWVCARPDCGRNPRS